MQSSATDSTPDPGTPPPSLQKPPATRKIDPRAKWLETDGLGGFSSATVSGLNTHRSQGIFAAAKKPPLDRFLLVSALEVVVETPEGEFPLVRRSRAGDSSPDSGVTISKFESRPWPKWRYSLPGNLIVEHELFVRRGMSVVVLTWKTIPSSPDIRLRIRPILAGRHLDQLQNQSISFPFEPAEDFHRLTWKLAEGAPTLTAICDGTYRHDPVWYEGVIYGEDLVNGVPASEDLGSPGEYSWEMGTGRAHLIFEAENCLEANGVSSTDPSGMARTFRNAEEMRRKLIANPLQQFTDHYIIRRPEDDRLNIMASYPAGSQRSSDTLVALRGICLSLGRFEIAQKILSSLLEDFSDGVLPSLSQNQTDQKDVPFESPDPTLWFILVAHEFLDETERRNHPVEESFREKLISTCLKSLASFERGNALGMYVDDGGLLSYRPPGQSPGKSVGGAYNVATQALWLNAAWTCGGHDRKWKNLFDYATPSFADRFWFEAGGYLCDSLNQQYGTILKARQVLAVGGLPQPILDEFRSNLVLQRIEDQLWTPYGLRIAVTGTSSTSPICSWLLGPFVEAWLRAHIDEEDALNRATKRFIAPWMGLLKEDGLNHIGEGSTDEGHASVPFYAPATAELLRILALVDGTSRQP
jgi:predicted glycogen debranching enzyme